MSMVAEHSQPSTTNKAHTVDLYTVQYTDLWTLKNAVFIHKQIRHFGTILSNSKSNAAYKDLYCQLVNLQKQLRHI
jgi:uncharacterized protein YlbG (UPF0298 family)